MVWLVIGIVVLVVGAVLIYFGRRTQAKTDLLKSVPTSNAADVAGLMPGEMVEVKGVARCDQPLTGEQSQRPSVWYAACVSREYEERQRDSRGEWETNRGSETISSNTQCALFFVEDNSGRVQVDPDGAEVDAQTLVDRFESEADTSGVLGKVSIDIGGFNLGQGDGRRTLGYRYREQAIPVDTQVYVLGAVGENGVIGRPPAGSDGKLIISHRTEEALTASWGKTAQRLAYVAIALMTVGLVLIVIGAVTLIS